MVLSGKAFSTMWKNARTLPRPAGGSIAAINGSCRRHVRRIARDVRVGRYEPKIEKQEADLYMNPRRVR